MQSGLRQALLGGGSRTWRGMGQAMSLNVQGFNGTTNWSRLTRSRHYSNARFRRFRVVLQTFYPNGAPIADTDFALNYDFQVGFEYPYTNSNSGLAARIPVTFSGATTVSYTNASGPRGYILSDIIDLGYWVPAAAFFGLWTVIENHAHSGTNTLPYQANASNIIERYLGGSDAATTQIGAAALTASSIAHIPTSVGGQSTYFAPCMMLIETDSRAAHVAVIGDSIAYGIGEGTDTSTNTIGDPMGSPLGNKGYLQRGLFEVASANSINCGVSSDRIEYLATAANWSYRNQLLTLANPTHVIQQNIHNDMASLTLPGSWAATTAFNKYDIKADGIGNNIYMCTQSGTTGSTRPTGTSAGTPIIDGTVIWQYLAAQSTDGNRALRIFGLLCNLLSQISSALPSARRLGVLCTPDASSTDSWATAVNQTVSAGFGTSTSRRGILNARIRTLDPLLGTLSGYLDPNTYLEDSYPTETSKWFNNGTAKLCTTDGTHPDSNGALLGSAAVTASMFS